MVRGVAVNGEENEKQLIIMQNPVPAVINSYDINTLLGFSNFLRFSVLKESGFYHKFLFYISVINIFCTAFYTVFIT